VQLPAAFSARSSTFLAGSLDSAASRRAAESAVCEADTSQHPRIQLEPICQLAGCLLIRDVALERVDQRSDDSRLDDLPCAGIASGGPSYASRSTQHLEVGLGDHSVERVQYRLCALHEAVSACGSASHALPQTLTAGCSDCAASRLARISVGTAESQ
jgi:hypothetical protein